MGYEKDMFTELFEEEFDKIPWLFRFGKIRFKAATVIMIAAFIAMCILTSVFYMTGRAESIQAPISLYTTGGEMVVNTYDYGFLIAAIICGAVSVLIALWMVISKQFEKHAFSKASHLSNMIYLSERHMNELKWQDWKMQNRDY